MSNESQHAAPPKPTFTAMVTSTAERLAAGVCPWCFQPKMSRLSDGTTVVLFCSSCSFTFGNHVKQHERTGTALEQEEMTSEVSQALLLELQLVRDLDARKNAVRQRILMLLQQGVDVQAGYLHLEIRESLSRTITHDLIRDLCGPDVLESLKRRAAERTITQIFLHGPMRT